MWVREKPKRGPGLPLTPLTPNDKHFTFAPFFNHHVIVQWNLNAPSRHTRTRLMTTQTRTVTIFLALLILSACSSQEEVAQPEGYFATHTEQDGSRLFQYSFDAPVQASGKNMSDGKSGGSMVGGQVSGNSSRGVSGGVTVSNRQGKPSGPPGGKRGRSNHQATLLALESGLERELKESQFCPQGYRELERVVGPSEFFIKGECSPPADT